MTALGLNSNERWPTAIYDRPQPGFRFTRKTLAAMGVVAIFYGGLGALMMTQKIRVMLAPPQDPGPVVIYEPTKTLPPPKRANPTVKPLTPVRAPTIIETDIPVDPVPLTPHPDAPAPIGPIAVINDPGPTPSPGPAIAAPTPAPVIGNPNWISKPTAAQLGRLYPGRAAELEKNGGATLLCAIKADGSMGACSVIDESPKGFQFGEAALASARYFKISPKTVNGQAVEGSKVRIPIIFNLG